MHPSEAKLDALARSELDASLEAHLAGCSACAARLRSRRAVFGLLAELPETEPSELEWKRIDRHVIEAIDVDVARRARRRSGWYMAVPAVAALAACALVGMKVWSVTHPPPAVAQVAPPQPAVALAFGGNAHTGRSGPEILEGDLLDAAGGTLEVQTAPATGIALAAGAQAQASRLRVGETELTLEKGELLAEVKPLAPGARFEVKASDLTVHVVGTAFLVARTAGAVRVAVVHGKVRVDRAGQESALFVSGGTEALIPDGAALAAIALSPIPGELAARFPLEFPDMEPDDVERQFGQAQIESEPAGADARLDGAARGITPLTLLASEGTHEVELRLAGHKPQRHVLHVSRTRAQTTLALAAAVPLEQVAAVAPPAPTLSPPAVVRRGNARPAAVHPASPAPQQSYAEAFRNAAVTHQAEVQRCYAQQEGERARRLHLVLSIQPTGQVAPPVQVEEPGVAPEFVDCLTRAARTWSFPAPGRTYEVSIPYELQPR